MGNAEYMGVVVGGAGRPRPAGCGRLLINLSAQAGDNPMVAPNFNRKKGKTNEQLRRQTKRDRKIGKKKGVKPVKAGSSGGKAGSRKGGVPRNSKKGERKRRIRAN